MPVSARASVSFRPWIAAAIALALMMSLAAVMAPAGATDSPDGTVVFVEPPVRQVGEPPVDALVADETGVASFVVAVEGHFPVDAAELVGRVQGIDVLVELLAGEATMASATRATSIVGDVPTATIELDLREVAGGEYTVRATATTRPAGTVLGDVELGPLTYYPNGEFCEGGCTVTETNGEGFTATVALVGDGFVNLELPQTSPYDLLGENACPGDHTRLPETVLFDIIVGTNGAKEAEITVDLTRRARQFETNNGISQYQFCYLGGADFTGRDGTPAGPAPERVTDVFPKLLFGPALLPDCDATNPQAPCVLDRRSRGGGAQFTFLVPTGDPMFR